jgi:hypothetical protein
MTALRRNATAVEGMMIRKAVTARVAAGFGINQAK